MNEGKNFSVVAGSNDDQYTGQGKIWHLAQRSNTKPKVVRVRKVKTTERVALG